MMQKQTLTDSEISLIAIALKMASEKFAEYVASPSQHPHLIEQFDRQRHEAIQLQSLFEGYPEVVVGEEC